MAKLVWDAPGSRFYETGVSHGVLFPIKEPVPAGTIDPYPDDTYGTGVAWNGLTSVSQSGSGGEPTPLWADDIKYLNIISSEQAALTIEAYTYPDEWMECDGSRETNGGVIIGQQPRKQFAFSYRTIKGNDLQSNDYGYKIHLVYGCFATPTDRSYSSVNDSPEAITFSWSISTTPVEMTGFKPTATIEIDSTKVDAAKLLIFENYLYGRDASGEDQNAVAAQPPRMPMPNKVIELFPAQ